MLAGLRSYSMYSLYFAARPNHPNYYSWSFHYHNRRLHCCRTVHYFPWSRCRLQRLLPPFVHTPKSSPHIGLHRCWHRRQSLDDSSACHRCRGTLPVRNCSTIFVATIDSCECNGLCSVWNGWYCDLWSSPSTRCESSFCADISIDLDRSRRTVCTEHPANRIE